MNYKRLVDTATLAGELMLASGAETYRVEDTIQRILKISGFQKCEAVVVSMAMVVSLEDESIETINTVRKVEERNTNLGHIEQVNEISRKLCDGTIQIEEAHQKLDALSKYKRYPKWLIYLCTIITSATFCALLGATALECMLAAGNGVFVILGDVLNKRYRINRFVVQMGVCFCIAVTTSYYRTLPILPIQIEPVIVGSIMSLLPGVAVTNAIRDTLQGDYNSGVGRAIEAFVTAASLAVGIGAGLAIGRVWFMGI